MYLIIIKILNFYANINYSIIYKVCFTHLNIVTIKYMFHKYL